MELEAKNDDCDPTTIYMMLKKKVNYPECPEISVEMLDEFEDYLSLTWMTRTIRWYVFAVSDDLFSPMLVMTSESADKRCG